MKLKLFGLFLLIFLFGIVYSQNINSEAIITFSMPRSFDVYKDVEKRGPEYGNPNKVIPAFEEIIEVGAVTVIKDDAEQTEYKFAGKELNGIMTMKKEGPASDIYVFSKGAKE